MLFNTGCSFDYTHHLSTSPMKFKNN